MNLPAATLAGMRKTNDLFCSAAIGQRNMNVLDQAEAAGDDVVEIGRAELTTGDGHKVPIKYVVHWRFEENAWKWHTDIWNMNQ